MTAALFLIAVFLNVEPGGWHRGEYDATMWVVAVYPTMGNCIRARDERAEPMSYGECEWVSERDGVPTATIIAGDKPGEAGKSNCPPLRGLGSLSWGAHPRSHYQAPTWAARNGAEAAGAPVNEPWPGRRSTERTHQ